MNSLENPLWPALKNLSKQLNLLNGLIGYLEAQLGNSREKIEKVLVDKNLNKSFLYSGSRLAIRDLSDFKHGYFFFGPIEYMFKAKGEDYYRMINTLTQRKLPGQLRMDMKVLMIFLMRSLHRTLLFTMTR